MPTDIAFFRKAQQAKASPLTLYTFQYRLINYQII